MSDVPAGPDRQEVPLVKWLPWVRLFRGVGLSFDGRKLVLAALGVVTLGLGHWGLGGFFEGTTTTRPGPFPRLVSESLGDVGWSSLPAIAAWMVADPLLAPASRFARLLDPTATPLAFIRAGLEVFWTALVWGLLGGAIARMALMEMAGGSWIGMGTALRFTARRLIALVGAPLSPLIGIGFFGALCALVGLLYWIPGPIGASIAGLLAFLPLLAGLVMALIAVGLAVGWPLMIATVAAEGEDAFDALSRSYSYVFQRPWRLAAYGLLAWGLGIVGFLFVRIFAGQVVRLALWGLGLGGPDERLLQCFQQGAGTGVPEAIHAFWLTVVDLLAFGWIYAYFWSAVAIIYLLLRSEIDGAAFEEIFDPRPDRDTIPSAPEMPPAEGSGS